jgi:hypothetical protein
MVGDGEIRSEIHRIKNKIATRSPYKPPSHSSTNVIGLK